MKWKEFLKPDWRKIVIFVILFIIGTLIPTMFIYSCLGCYDTIIGFPVSFYVKKGWPLSEIGKINFSIFNLVIDIIVWYLLSCIIVWVYDKRKKK